MEKIELLVMVIFLAILSIEDIRYKEVKRLHFVYMLPVSITISVYNINNGNTSIYELVTGVAIVIVIAGVGKFSRGIGGGDSMTLFLLSIMCGIEKLLIGIGISLVIVYMVAIVMLIKKQLNKKTTLPYIPFLSIGMIYSIL